MRKFFTILPEFRLHPVDDIITWSANDFEEEDQDEDIDFDDEEDEVQDEDVEEDEDFDQSEWADEDIEDFFDFVSFFGDFDDKTIFKVFYTNKEYQSHHFRITEVKESVLYGPKYIDAFCIDKDGEYEGIERTFRIERFHSVKIDKKSEDWY